MGQAISSEQLPCLVTSLLHWLHRLARGDDTDTEPGSLDSETLAQIHSSVDAYLQVPSSDCLHGA